MKKLPKIITASLMGLLLGCTNTTASIDKPEPNSWRFINLADWHSAEKFIMGERYGKAFEDKVQEDIATLKWMRDNVGGELILLPGDSNGGHWDRPKFIKKFNSKLTPRESILQAGKLCYEGMVDTFEQGGYSTLLMAVGDHEVGDNPWPVGSNVAKYQAEFKQVFAQAFNYTKDGKSFKYTEKIGQAEARPLGTKYQDTSYAYRHKNALFVTVDAFHQQDYLTQLGEEGTVTGTVVGQHLTWFESVLAEARKDNSIKHIFVQSHLPAIYPVRKVSSSGMMLDDGIDNPFWQAMRKYQVDIYFAGEVHANTVTKDPESNLIQLVTRGNFFDNFQTVDVSDDKIAITLLRHYGSTTSDGNYQTAGQIIIDKSTENTKISTSGELAMLTPKSKLLHFDFERSFEQIDRPINGLSEKKSSYVIDGKKVSKSFANMGSFGSQYDALHTNIELVEGFNGQGARFNNDSRMSVFAMGPLQGGNAIGYQLSFKTTSTNNQILINTAPIWGNKPARFLNLYLDDGIPVVAYSKSQLLTADAHKLNDGKWHTISVSMPHNNSQFSELVINIDGKVVTPVLSGSDVKMNLNKAMRFAVGGKGYSKNALKSLPHKNFTGVIDEVSLWTVMP